MERILAALTAIICILVIAPPAAAEFGGGDDCSSAEVISELPYMDRGSTAGAVDDYDETCVFESPGSGDVVYAYTPPADCSISIWLCEGSYYHTKLYVYENTCGAYQSDTQYDCNDDACASATSQCLLFSALTDMAVTAGNTYYIVIDGDAGDEGDFTLNVDYFYATGACCLPDESCDIITEAECVALGGTYEGDDTICGAITGYTSWDCDDEWECIYLTGNIAINASTNDDDGDIVPIGFTFNYYGDDHTDVGITSNGYLTFGSDLYNPTNVSIPDISPPNDLITPMWDDYKPNWQGHVRYMTLGNAPYRRFIGEWIYMREDDPPHDRCTFQTILHEGSNEIMFRYWEFPPESYPGDRTAGLENQDGTEGVSLDTMLVEPFDCYMFHPLYEADACGAADTDMDIKPTSCPNSVNLGNSGLLPVAITGSMTFDVTEIDVTTLRISRADGVGGTLAPVEDMFAYEDVATPFAGDLCDCHELGGDGYTDLSIKFNVLDMNDALEMGDLMFNDYIELVVRGDLIDGSSFSVSDCIRNTRKLKIKGSFDMGTFNPTSGLGN